MGSQLPGSFQFARLAGIGAVVFFANSALLVLQLVASRLLAPFIGSDLYTWTSIIGVFLLGIALGNVYGGRIADRFPSPRTLALVLLAGSVAAAWMALAPGLFRGFYRAVPLGPRIPLLAVMLCLPAGFILSLLTPLAIKLGLPDVSKTGRVTGLIFALSTLGCLIGNYATGFYLVPAFTIDTLVFGASSVLAVLGIGVSVVMAIGGETVASASAPVASANTPVANATGSTKTPVADAKVNSPVADATGSPGATSWPRLSAFAVVFLASFCGMTLELTASRVIAEKLGVSLFTWTGIIGVMLAGTALGNLTGGFLADRANQPGGMRRAMAWLASLLAAAYVYFLIADGLRPLSSVLHREDLLEGVGSAELFWAGLVAGIAAGIAVYLAVARMQESAVNPRSVLAATLVAAGAGAVFIFIARAILTHADGLDRNKIIEQVMVWTFALFFVPMFALGMVSPQVIRLAVPDVAHVGQVAGRIYAWSTAGAIVGTFATGYLSISLLGVDRVVLVVSSMLVCVGCALLGHLYLRISVWVGAAGLFFSLLPGEWPLAARLSATLGLGALAWVDVPIRLLKARSRHGSLAEALVARKRSSVPEPAAGVMIYAISIVLGGITGGFILLGRFGQEEDLAAMVETNYYKIKVKREYQVVDGERVFLGELSLYLDALLHSSVNLHDPTYIYYPHEHVQMEFLRAARAEAPNPKALVIGGGGYTFPRYAKTLIPETRLDVVEIDPGVTRVAYQHLGLKKDLGITDYNMDGRQFVAERAEPGSYDLIIQDAVNDLSVPSHLLTKEYNDEVKAALKAGSGVYLLTIIDEIEYGKLWRAMLATLRQSFQHVALLSAEESPPVESRHVYVIYASDRPLNVAELREKNIRVAGKGPLAFHTHQAPDALLEPFLKAEPGVILTDQYAPVDNLMADVFRHRDLHR